MPNFVTTAYKVVERHVTKRQVFGFVACYLAINGGSLGLVFGLASKTIMQHRKNPFCPIEGENAADCQTYTQQTMRSIMLNGCNGMLTDKSDDSSIMTKTYLAVCASVPEEKQQACIDGLASSAASFQQFCDNKNSYSSLTNIIAGLTVTNVFLTFLVAAMIYIYWKEKQSPNDGHTLLSDDASEKQNGAVSWLTPQQLKYLNTCLIITAAIGLVVSAIIVGFGPFLWGVAPLIKMAHDLYGPICTVDIDNYLDACEAATHYSMRDIMKNYDCSTMLDFDQSVNAANATLNATLNAKCTNSNFTSVCQSATAGTVLSYQQYCINYETFFVGSSNAVIGLSATAAILILVAGVMAYKLYDQHTAKTSPVQIALKEGYNNNFVR